MIRLNYLVFIAAMVLMACKESQKKTLLTVTGLVQNIEGTKVYLEQDGAILDSTVVKNGTFSVSGKAIVNTLSEVFFTSHNPKISRGLTGWGHSIPIFVEDGAKHKIIAEDKDAILHNTYRVETDGKNTKLYSDFVKQISKKRKELRTQIANIVKDQGTMRVKQDKVLYNRLDDSIVYKEAKLNIIDTEIRHEFVRKHANSYSGIYELSKASDIGVNTPFYIDIEKKLTKEFREHPYGQQFIKVLARHRFDLPVNIKIEAVDTAYKKFSYEDFKNDKLLILDFWATWCAPCLQEMPSALRIEKAFKNRNVSYIFISFDSRLKTWQQQSEALGLTHSYRVKQADKGYLLKTLHLNTIPRYVIADPKGNVLVKEAPSPSDPAFPKLVEKLLASKK